MKCFCYAALFLLAGVCCYGQQDAVIPFEKAYKRTYPISKTLQAPPLMDGRLDDSFWTEQGEWTDPFVQVTPYERVPSPSPTRAKLLYDDRYIYVAVYCKDIRPEQIIRFIGNRDDNNTGDLISIAFDTYHDYRAAPEFNINTGGNKTDLVVTDRLEVNRSWNAVWEGRTHVDIRDSSWTAELRIPFSQLRYNRESTDGLWGLHIRRIIRRNNEVQNWSLIPLKNNGHVFSFGMMQGMTDLPKPKGIEILPYAMSRYRDKAEVNAGVDMKFGLSDFTLDLTVNPDFGQVELDPSVMNLTAYETFYDEKRPFFLEGKHILDFAAGSNRMFYTRRIGAAPSYAPAVDNVNSFDDSKGNVPIIGALKLTGTSRNGLTLGVIQSLTARSSARVTRYGEQSRETVEPLTNYTVARIQKNWKGNILLGGMITSVNRSLAEPYLKDFMVSDAFTAGIDYTQYFRNRLYYVDFKGIFSSLAGSSEAIARLQQNPVHYFQRESAAGYLGVDPTRTSLSGTGGYVKVGRKGNSRWAFSEMFGWSSPGFDLNTIGYLKQADILSMTTEAEFRQTNVWKIFRSNTVTFQQYNEWDYGRRPNLSSLALNWKTMLLNRYEWTLSESYGWNRSDTRKLRGGPDLSYDPYFRTTLAFNTDKARRLIFTLNYVDERNIDKINRANTLTPALSLRMGNHVHLAGEFTYSQTIDHTQYVAAQTYQAPESSNSTAQRTAYLIGHMEQKTYGLTLKLQVNATPDISLQFYGSPFTSTARYSDLRQAPGAVQAPEWVITYPNPDFSFNEFRSNVVGRWEYRPGSTLYLVWEHRMSNRENRYLPAWGDNLDRMASLPSIDTFMLKINYWFNL
jgi:hypothetical protein